MRDPWLVSLMPTSRSCTCSIQINRCWVGSRTVLSSAFLCIAEGPRYVALHLRRGHCLLGFSGHVTVSGIPTFGGVVVFAVAVFVVVVIVGKAASSDSESIAPHAEKPQPEPGRTMLERGHCATYRSTYGSSIVRFYCTLTRSILCRGTSIDFP